MSANYSLRIDAGATYDAVQFRYLEDDKVTPVDLTGWDIRAQIREYPSAALKLELNPEWDSATGLISLVISATDTGTLTADKYVWALEVEKDGVVVRIVSGTVKVSAEVVR